LAHVCKSKQGLWHVFQPRFAEPACLAHSHEPVKACRILPCSSTSPTNQAGQVLLSIVSLKWHW
jgi:hypothetical protein